MFNNSKNQNFAMRCRKGVEIKFAKWLQKSEAFDCILMGMFFTCQYLYVSVRVCVGMREMNRTIS
uniref:Uncharacterized protein n=1 Tax=Octopus bimaculoides TaxID=37653 RepID=A0A0L8HD12_OCTBM